ncbi:MAG: AmmeMemoRadiSam system protein B [Phycisphaerales bacterium]|nr:MAG: AmmeMemoRadiSam system protein B [Phycisphaerales bacterium]
MSIREPVVAGSFYPGQAESCRRELAACVPDSLPAEVDDRKLVGGVVPHAGWMFSGAVAGKVLAALARQGRCSTYVLFGAAHRSLAGPNALFATGVWRTPLGDVSVDGDLAHELMNACPDIVADEEAHRLEHSLEVQLPFIQHVAPEARFVPIMVLPSSRAAELGRQIGEAVAGIRQDVTFVGSSDLTHYGPRYGFQPAGTGEKGLEWSRNVNDRRMIDCLVSMRAEEIVGEAATNHNACGAGALAATVAACRACGAKRGILLDYRTSADVEPSRGLLDRAVCEDMVGYAGVVFA